jgi:hypothetical protein
MKRWVVAAWAAIWAVAVGLELFVLLDGDPTTPPLTDVISAFIPEIIAIGFFGWVFLHFLRRYWRD